MNETTLIKIKALQNALLSAFPNPDDLTQMFFFCNRQEYTRNNCKRKSQNTNF